MSVAWSQLELIRATGTDSCGDIICRGDAVLYNCQVPILDNGSVIIAWRLMPQCQRGVQEITFLRNDIPLYTVCDDRRTIQVQGVDTSNGTIFISSLNITNITSSQSVECLFDDGRNELPVGISEVYTTGE